MNKKQRNKNFIISCLNHLGPCTYKQIGWKLWAICDAMKELENEWLVSKIKKKPAVYALDCHISKHAMNNIRNLLSQWERVKIIWKGFFSF